MEKGTSKISIWNLSTREALTVAISVLALSVSCLSFYYSHIRTSLKLEAVTLNADPAGGVLDFQIAILNPGNRKALITNAQVLVLADDAVLHGSNPLSEVQTNLQLPVAIDPNSILVMNFEGPIDLPALYERGADPDSGTGLGEFNGVPTKKVALGAIIESLDFRGTSHFARSGELVAHITMQEIAGWNFDDTKKSVFGN